eukprot:scaffold64590_cov32-Tisochrysis_lutea.AAC.5
MNSPSASRAAAHRPRGPPGRPVRGKSTAAPARLTSVSIGAPRRSRRSLSLRRSKAEWWVVK